jgi:hypothetical protein
MYIAAAAVILGIFAAITIITALRRSTGQSALVTTGLSQSLSQPDPSITTREQAADPAGRRPATVPILRIVDSTNQPIQDAIVRCTRATDALLSLTPATDAWWQQVESETDTFTSTSEGMADLASLEKRPNSSFFVIWVYHPDFVSIGFTSDIVGGHLNIPAKIQMSLAPHLSALVHDVEGHSVPGAVVAETIDQETISSRFDLRNDTALVFRYVARADDAGRVSLMPAQRKLAIQAHDASLLSEVWRGLPTRESTILITLQPTFRAQGTLQTPHLLPLSGAWVSVATLQNDSLRSLVQCSVASDGSWGPVPVPLVTVDQYVFQVHASGFVPHEVYRSPPRQNELLNISFILEPGLSFVIEVMDDEHKPVNAAQVQVGWEHDRHWTWVSLNSNGKGIATFEEVPPGSIRLDISHRGYVGQSRNDLYFRESSSIPVEILLSKAGIIDGRAFFRNLPVNTFVVEYWSTGVAPRSKLFESADDGHYALDEVPLGQVFILGRALDGRRSDAYKVLVSEVPTTINLHLNAAVVGTGRIVDALTSEPLPNATVHPLEVIDGNAIAYSAPACPVDARGQFNCMAFAPGPNLIEVRCADYAALSASGTGSSGTVDFGVIPLSRPTNLQISLDCDSDADPRMYWAEVMAPISIPIQAFSDSKLIAFNNVTTAEYTVEGLYPNGTTYRVMKSVRGRSTKVDIKARHIRNLKGLLVSAPGSTAMVASCGACFETGDGASVVMGLHIEDDRSIDLSTVPVEDFRLVVSDDTGAYLADELIHGASSLQSPLLIRLGDERAYVRVVNAEGAPIDAGMVLIVDPADRFHTFFSATTDSDGRAIFSLTTNSIADFIVSLADESVCVFPSVPLKSTLDHPVTLTVDSTFSIKLSVQDGETLLPGVRLTLRSPLSPSYTIATQQSNDSGAVISFSGLGKGGYLISENQEGLWPRSELMESSKSAGLHVFQVRRVGSVNIQVMKNGLPVSGLVVAVSSLDFSIDVSEWLSQSLCLSSSGSLRIDEFGKLRLDGLPRGSYRLSAQLPDGQAAETMFSIEPHKVVDVALLMP